MNPLPLNTRSRDFETLEPRQLLSYNWGPYPTLIGQPAVVADYPWLDGSNEAVAVVDQGVDYNHPALSDGSKGPGIGRGHRVVAGYNYVDDNGDPMDTFGHGTGVAGIIGGDHFTLNGLDFQGLAPNINIVALRQDTGPEIKQSLDWIIANHATYNIQVVNLTDFIGVDTTDHDPSSYLPELQELNALNIFIATPVGNDDAPMPGDPIVQLGIGLPATSPYVMGVGGIDQSDNFYTLSRKGTGLSILGPATNVSMPYFIPATAGPPPVAAQEPFVDYAQGTSWAAAHVTGAAALLKQINPDFTPAQIEQILEDSGTPVNVPGMGNVPSLNVDAAVQLAYQQANDSFGNNHSFANAAPLLLNNGNFTNNRLKYLIGQDNYYSFDLTKKGTVDINVGYKTSAFYAAPTATLYDSRGNLIGNIGTALTASLKPGKYIIQIHSPVSLAGHYGISLNTNGAGAPAGPSGTIGASSMAYTAGGQLDLAFYDTSSHSLDFATRARGVWSTTKIVDASAADVGSELSLAVDSDGNPGIAYYDATDGDLRYAYFNGRRWGHGDVDTSGAFTGQNPSLAFDGTNPAISYYVSSGGLRIATLNRSAWSIKTVDRSGDDVGLFSSLALNPKADVWSVAYTDATNGSFRFASQARRSYAVTVVDNSGVGGSNVSLAYNSAALPAFSYYDSTNGDLRFAQFNGSAWSVNTVAAHGNQGLSSYLYFGGGTTANIVYYSPASDTEYLATGSGKRWAISSIEGGALNLLAVAVDPGSPPTLAWLDSASGTVFVQ